MNFLNKLSFALILLTAILFPILIIPALTEPFVLPKYGLVLAVVLILLAISAIRLLKGEQVTLVRTPFDWPLLGLALTLIVSTFLSVSLFDSIVATIQFLSLILFYYILINTLKAEKEVELFTIFLTLGAALASVVLILAFIKIYPLSFLFNKAALNAVQATTFSTFGNLLGAAIFLLSAIPLGWSVSKLARGKNNLLAGLTFTSTIIIAVGFLLALYQLFSIQKPVILPYEYGIQAATGAIGQNVQTLLFGSGPGTFIADFTRFINPSFNAQTFWNSIFSSGSSFLLDSLATGGLLSLLFLIYLVGKIVRHRANSFMYLALVLAVAILVVIPVSFSFLFLFFSCLALHTRYLAKENQTLVYETKAQFISDIGDRTNVLSIALAGLIIAIAAGGFYFGTRFIFADHLFQKSLVAAADNRGLDTYNLQRQAIAITIPRDNFYRVFSQTNLALANSISQDLRSKNASPSAQEQQNILTLVQQAISNGQTATQLSARNFLNWDNLGGIYRNLVGFGNNAEKFAIDSFAQAVNLYPNNPLLRLSLGGVYYQLGNWEQAQRQFEIAVNLKPDFANAYYNLGHALENKGDLQNALSQYQAAESLLARDNANKETDNYKKLVEEIEALKQRIAREGAQVAPVKVAGQGQQQPPSQLPKQSPKVEIPPPSTATESAK